MPKLNTKEIASIAIFGALSAIITTSTNLPIFRFPILPFLRFDLGEIIDFLAFLILGPIPAIFVVAIHFFTISLFPGAQVPIASQAMKAASILSTIIGFLIVTKIRSAIIAILGAIAGRVSIMTIANYLFFLVFFPTFFNPALASIAKTTGIAASSFWLQVGILLSFLAIFNAIHAIITSAIPLYILKKSPQLLKLASQIKEVWVVKYLKFK